MSRALTIVAFMVCASSVFSQRFLEPTWLEIGPKRAFVGAYGYGSIASAQVSNTFLRNISNSQQLDGQVKEDQMMKFKTSNNLVGGNYSLGLQGGFTLKNLCASVVFSVTDEAHLSALFPGDLGKFALDGNKQFAGDAVSMNRTTFAAMRYQKMGVGVNFHPSEDVSYGGMLSFLNGESTTSLNINQGSMYTSSIGDTVLLEVRGSAFYSDTSNTGFLKHNGGGASIDLFFTQRIEAFGNDWEVSALLMNMGVIQWHPETGTYAADTNVIITGIELNDVNNAQSIINAYNLEDSILGGVRSGFGRRTINQVIPGFMQLEVRRNIEQGFDAGAGMVIRWQTISRTYTWLNLGYKFSRQFGLSSEFGYGGYGAFQAGLEAMYRNDWMAANIRIANLEAAIAPNTFGGITVGCGLQYFFGL